MGNLLDGPDRDALLARVGALASDAPALWGRMDARQMLCHLTDSLRLPLGDRTAEDASTFFTRTALKWLVLAGVPAPKGKVDTFPELDQIDGSGTPPADFDADREELVDLVRQFVARAAKPHTPLPRSPIFGKLTPRQWGQLMHIHSDHHLRQFGV